MSVNQKHMRRASVSRAHSEIRLSQLREISKHSADDGKDVVSRIAKGTLDRVSTNSKIATQETWQSRSAKQVLTVLQSSLQNGLAQGDAFSRFQRVGPNELRQSQRKTLLRLFMEQMSNILMIILSFAGIVSLMFQQYPEAVVIFVIIVTNVSVSVYQERRADDALAALMKMSAPLAMCKRDGQWRQVPTVEIVPGDIIKVVAGDVVPADLRVLQSADLTVEEKSLTGESTDVRKEGDYEETPEEKDMKEKEKEHAGREEKDEFRNMMFSTTSVTAGWGIGIAVLTGMQTRIGKIAQLLDETNADEAARIRLPGKAAVAKDMADEVEEAARAMLTGIQAKLRSILTSDGTPLQNAMHRLGFGMGMIAVGTALLVYIVGVATNYNDPAHADEPTWLQMLLLSVSLAVSGVPEGLPVIFTITLSLGMQRMSRRGCLVRTLPSVETLSCANVICTDKTGTLTTGQMSVRAFWAAGVTYKVDPAKISPNIEENPSALAAALAFTLCNNAALQKGADGAWTAVGSSTERPLLSFSSRLGIIKGTVDETYKKEAEVAYSSSRKMMSTVHRADKSNDKWLSNVNMDHRYVVCTKGAPTFVLKHCTHVMRADGTHQPITEADIAQIHAVIDDFSSKAFRVLGAALKPLDSVPAGDGAAKAAVCEKDLVFAGLVACQDPERPEVKEAIATARRAGVRTVMITGDHLATAVAIAKNIELLDPTGLTAEEYHNEVSSRAVDCSVLRRHDRDGHPILDGEGNYEYQPPEVIDRYTRSTVVFARAQPQDKYEIVLSLQDRQGLVAAMTGDGVNDAPALKAADIGVSMGITGTETAKQASDVVLTDDNFASIVNAIADGRQIYANIQKFVVFLISVNTSELIFIAVCIFIGLPSPFEPLQILLLNLLTDSLPAMALCVEKADANNMSMPPRPKTADLMDRRLRPAAIGGIIGFVSLAFSIYLVGLSMHTKNMGSGGIEAKHGIERARTMTFIGLAISEYIRAYSVKSASESIFRRDIFDNALMQKCVGFSAASITLCLALPGLKTVFGFVAVDFNDILVGLAFNVVPLSISEFVKYYFYRRVQVRHNLDIPPPVVVQPVEGSAFDKIEEEKGGDNDDELGDESSV